MVQGGDCMRMVEVRKEKRLELKRRLFEWGGRDEVGGIRTRSSSSDCRLKEGDGSGRFRAGM